MAAISITAGDVQEGAGATIKEGTAGATITAGQIVYIDTSAGDVLKLADADLSALASTVAGIALNGASSGQKVRYATKAPALVLTTTTPILAADTLWLSPTAGGITKTAADMVSGCYVTSLGVMTSTTICNFQITRGALKA
jgi:hypothetical protein